MQDTCVSRQTGWSDIVPLWITGRNNWVRFWTKNSIRTRVHFPCQGEQDSHEDGLRDTRTTNSYCIRYMDKTTCFAKIRCRCFWHQIARTFTNQRRSANMWLYSNVRILLDSERNLGMWLIERIDSKVALSSVLKKLYRSRDCYIYYKKFIKKFKAIDLITL